MVEDLFADYTREVIHSVYHAMPDGKDYRLVVMVGKYDDDTYSDANRHAYRSICNSVYKVVEKCDIDGLILSLGSLNYIGESFLRSSLMKHYSDIPKVFISSNLEGCVSVRYDNESGIREAIDVCMEQKPTDMEELLRLLREMGYEIKRGKHISVKGGDQKKFLRFRSLGVGYREEDLERVFSGETKHTGNPKQPRYNNPEVGRSGKKIDMLLDIQAMIAKGKGPGYERWAKVHNIKQMAQTLLFLEQHDLREYEKLAERAKDASGRFDEILKKQKTLEGKLKEIVDLKKHIINYSKTKEVYAEYRQSGYSQKYFEEHREAITLHKAAKEAFSELKGPIPKIKELNSEYERVLNEKKQTYAEYRQARNEMKDLQTAKYNIDRFLQIEEE
jgi:hypothetical protein